MGELNPSVIKIVDGDLMNFWECLSGTYNQSFNIEGQDIGD